MDAATLLGHLGPEGQLLADLAERALPGSADGLVPDCEPMDLASLVRHVGSVHQLVTDWVRDGRRPIQWQDAPGPGEDLAQWLTDATAGLVAELGARAGDEPCSTWCATDRTVGFWTRRMAHETAVHRVDAARAVGAPWTVDDDLALDGVDEALDLWLGTCLGTGVGGSGRVVRLVATSESRPLDRTVRPLASFVEFGSATRWAQATVSGTPTALWCWAWGRHDEAHPVEVDGDVDAAREVRDLLARAQQ